MTLSSSIFSVLTVVTAYGLNQSGLDNNIKQLLDEVEHDIMNYQNLVSVLSASAFGFGR